METHAAIAPSDLALIESARIASGFTRLKGMALAHLFSAGLISYVVAGHGSPNGILVWLVCLVVLMAVRIAFLQWYRRDPAKLEHNRLWAGVSVAGAAMAGIVWGLGPILLISSHPADQWLWSLVIGGACAGAASLHAAYLKTALAFIYPSSVLLILSVFVSGAEHAVAIGALILSFVAVTSSGARQFSRQFGTTLAMQLTLERQSEELNRSNRQLSEEIEQHRKTAADLYQSQKMDALGKVTSGIAHDFNNLLTVVLINLERIRKSCPNSPIGASASLALEAANGGSRLIADLLSFSRREPLQPVVADLNSLIRQAQPLLAQTIERRATLEVELADRAWAVVDVAQFQSALINLVVNARDAMRKPGLIRIRTALVLLDEQDAAETGHGPGRFIRVEVADTGQGMAPEIADRAFEPFFTTKGTGEGTGLGLSQVYNFARQAGGMARLASIPGQGTCVTLLIPAAEAELPAPEAPAETGEALGPGRRLLLVDDNKAVLTVLGNALADEGWDVRCAEDALSALHILEQEESIDLLISDVNLPKGPSGLELAQMVTARWPYLAVLLMSGGRPEADELPAGTHFLAKPFRPHQLMTAIGLTLAGPRHGEMHASEHEDKRG
ncbi:ATP-binding protein [Sphingomonas quercus]|uniref:histidine kinase n=1 Tax=Sphingomonas quercus TaxID=2842451 RepID=A0ABS6BJ68_9SPHN|nr:ATP-binding protein [Sphingomonas quercus]MBU3077892.1 response regulator [Sphingomonas quercus]